MEVTEGWSEVLLTGPKIVPFQCLMSSPTQQASTVGPLAFKKKLTKNIHEELGSILISTRNRPHWQTI